LPATLRRIFVNSQPFEEHSQVIESTAITTAAAAFQSDFYDYYQHYASTLFSSQASSSQSGTCNKEKEERERERERENG
jgi:hypothetical protein